jgi:hypothetical protein
VDQLYVVTHPDPVVLDVQAIDHDAAAEDAIALAYYHRGNLLARGVVSPDAVEAIRGLLRRPVSLALAATEDDQGNIDARVCLVLPVDATAEGEEEPEEPWKASVPAPPPEVESSYSEESGGDEAGDEERPRLALLPIGNVVRGVRHRNHGADVAADAREMLDNLLAGRAQDAVSRTIDDLLDSI